jgi:putative photosynthetic complex assembly protein 2
MHYVWPVLLSVAVWWVSTGGILYLDGLPRRTHGAVLGIATACVALALVAIEHYSNERTVVSALVGFGASIVVWGWLELAFLTGSVTGPRRRVLDEGAVGTRRFGQAFLAIAYHELSILGAAGLLWGLTEHAVNRVALCAFLVLWIMRTSAKLNLFLGVRNLGEAFWPDHLAYLSSYLHRAKMNALYPLSLLGTLVGIGYALKVVVLAEDGFTRTASLLVATLLGLALFEHVCMMAPVRMEPLFAWGFRSRAALPQGISR